MKQNKWAIILPKILVAPIWGVAVRRGHAWRPKSIVGKSRFEGWREIARFSKSVLGNELLSTIQGNVDNLFVGFFLGLHALGMYYFAFNAGLGLTLGLITAAGVAVYPYLCQVRQDTEKLAKRFYKTRRKICLGIVILILTQTILAPIKSAAISVRKLKFCQSLFLISLKCRLLYLPLA